MYSQRFVYRHVFTDMYSQAYIHRRIFTDVYSQTYIRRQVFTDMFSQTSTDIHKDLYSQTLKMRILGDEMLIASSQAKNTILIFNVCEYSKMFMNT